MSRTESVAVRLARSARGWPQPALWGQLAAQRAHDSHDLWRLDAVVHEPAAPLGVDDILGAQPRELLRQGGLTHADCVLEIAHTHRPIDEQAKDAQALPMRHGFEHAHGQRARMTMQLLGAQGTQLGAYGYRARGNEDHASKSMEVFLNLF